MTSVGMGGAGSRPVLVVTNERDFAADLVIDRIRRGGGTVERWNTETPPVVEWRPEGASVAASAVWLRQYLPEPTRAGSVKEVDDFLVVREQWRAWLTDLAETDARWMNPLWAARRAENKLIQLRTAANLGFCVPPTVVTNDRAVAEKHEAEVGPCIVKAVSAAYFPFSTSAFMFTRPLAEALVLGDDDWAAQPVIVQQAVAPRVDVRVFIVGDHASAAATTTGGSDWRLFAGENTWNRLEAPAELVERCRAFNAELGLAYSAFDFAFDGSTCWFLECNQAGEFAFIDRPLELGVTDAIASWLTGGYE